MVQWLPLLAFTAVVGPAWISGQRTKIPQAEQCGQKSNTNKEIKKTK